MNIKTAKFEISNSDCAKCPAGNRPEYAFIGRSNVGKSSLINMLTNNKGLAKTSSTPGKTLLINHFLINDEVSLRDARASEKDVADYAALLLKEGFEKVKDKVQDVYADVSGEAPVEEAQVVNAAEDVVDAPAQEAKE